MASKYLRRLMRSALFSTRVNHQSAIVTAANKLNLKPILQEPVSNYNWKKNTPLRSIHASSLPLQGSLYLPSSFANEYGANEEEKSKLQGKLQIVPANFKPLPHQSQLQNRHNYQSCKLPAESSCSPTTSVSTYTQSCSAPSLRILGRHIITLPQKAQRGLCAPKGHVFVYVEAGRERHAVPIAYLSHPDFQVLLKRAESEFGFRQQGPGLRIPCSLSELRHTLHYIRAP